MNKLRRRLGDSLWGPAILAVVVIGIALLWAQSYLGRVSINDGHVQDCIETTELRWISAGKNQVDAAREYLLAGHSGDPLVARAHQQSADEATKLANATLKITAPTPARRAAYCHRLHPAPSPFGG